MGNPKEETIVTHRESITLKKLTKGIYNWEIKFNLKDDEDESVIIERLTKTNKSLKERFNRNEVNN